MWWDACSISQWCSPLLSPLLRALRGRGPRGARYRERLRRRQRRCARPRVQWCIEIHIPSPTDKVGLFWQMNHLSALAARQPTTKASGAGKKWNRFRRINIVQHSSRSLKKWDMLPPTKGASIYDVRTEEGGGSPKEDVVREVAWRSVPNADKGGGGPKWKFCGRHIWTPP